MWCQIDGCEPEGVLLDRSADIDDLKGQVLSGQSTKRSYRAYYQNQLLNANTRIPFDTTVDRPVILKKIDPSQSSGTNGKSIIRCYAVRLYF